LSKALAATVGSAIDRRTFLKRSGLTVGGIAAASSMSFGMVKKAEAAEAGSGEIKLVKSVCTHCSVGCSVIAEVKGGVWIGQEPGWDSPFNLGAHCAKGASVREHAHGERRLKYPVKLVDGKWERQSWDQAIDEIGGKILDIWGSSGPDSVYWLAAFAGTNNVDHQARICHSTTVAGVANTWGYGAMSNSVNDMHNSRAIFFIGSNPAEAHPVALQHILKTKEQNNAPLIVCDPRFTRTAAHADEFVRFRPGTDVALIWGILWHVFQNGWEDKEFIRQRVYGMDEIRAEVAKWTPEETERVTGVPGSQLKRVARTLANNRPFPIVWCMGGTQHSNGNNNTRAYCVLGLAMGTIGTSGGGANIFRGHDNVQGATDLGVLCNTLPGYYGLAAGSWKHWARVWEVDFDWLSAKFASKDLMEASGVPVSRWFDLALEAKENIEQPDTLKAMIFWGHAPNSQTRMPDMRRAMSKLDMLVVVDPYPTMTAVMHERTDGVYLLPAATQFETYGSVTATNRALQWRDKIVEPLFESLPDQTIMYKLAKKLGLADEMFKNIQVNDDEPLVEDLTREFNRGMWTVGYTGQSPERLKMHMANQHTFDKTSLQARGGPADGDFYGLPWPCWGTPEMGHPGTPVLYDTSKPVAEGGLCFRARFGVERDGVNLLAEGSYPVGSEIKDGYPEFTMAMLKKLGWDGDLTADEVSAIEAVAGDDTNWKTDLSGGIQRVAIKHGCAPYGNAKARTIVWNFPDPVPTHREPLYTSRRDLVADYPTYEDRRMYRLPILYKSIQDQDFSKDFPMILTSGRLVEYEGGGEETRSNPWLAELQQDMFVEINPVDANNLGIRDGAMVWLHGPEGGKLLIKALVTDRVGLNTAFMPFHFGGHWQGESLRDKYPAGADPYVLGEASNAAQTYGYDSVTNMQETKATLCRIEPA
jgi:formate dehydrogenase major subunit